MAEQTKPGTAPGAVSEASAVRSHAAFTSVEVFTAFSDVTVIVPPDGAALPPTVIGSLNGVPKGVLLFCICHVSIYVFGVDGA